MNSNKAEPDRQEGTKHKDSLQRDDLGIRIATAAALLLVIIAVIANPSAAHDVIQNVRTFITKYFSWWIIVAAGLALILCLWLALSKYGRIRLGGPNARPKYRRFVWVSMLFACGQGIGLIFWSVAEPIMVRNDNPLLDSYPIGEVNGALGWSYFHWAITAWAIYCIVAVCLAYSRFNKNKKPSFRGACEDIIPSRIRHGSGLIIEWLAIITTILGLATSFGFASLQFSSGLSTLFGIEASLILKVGVVIVIGLIAAISVFVGISKGMARISSLNSILSIGLIVIVFIFGPTLYLLNIIPESIGSYIQTFIPMSTLMDASPNSIESWSESWNGVWSVFIFCWCFAFSPFVASFIASISEGRTLREFIFGIIGIPSVIVVVWIGVIGGSALYYDDMLGGFISNAVAVDPSMGLFAMGQAVPYVGIVVIIVATILVGTYFITSVDSGIHALSGFVSTAAKPSALFKVVLACLITGVTLVLLLMGGDSVLDTIQTGTIVGALPFTIIVVIMVANLIKSLRQTSSKEIVDENQDGVVLAQDETTQGDIG